MANKEVCGKCESDNIVNDYEYGVYGGRKPGRKCFRCGSRNIKKTEEVDMSEKRKCSIEGCDKVGNIKGLCYRHYREEYGHPYAPVKKRAKSADGKKKKVEAKIPKEKDPQTTQPAAKKTMRRRQVIDKAREKIIEAEIKKLTAQAHHWELRAKYLEEQLVHPAAGDTKPAAPNKLVVIQIDFTGNEVLLEKIAAVATTQFRPVEYQILWFLQIATTQATPE